MLRKQYLTITQRKRPFEMENGQDTALCLQGALSEAGYEISVACNRKVQTRVLSSKVGLGKAEFDLIFTFVN